MTKRSLALAGFCVVVVAANYLNLRADEVQKTKPAARSRKIALQAQSVKSAPPDTLAAKAVINKYCVTCHNAQTENCWASARYPGRPACRRSRGVVGKSGAQASHGRDAASWNAASG